MTTAKDFTMASNGADIYGNPFHAFGWIMEGESLTALELTSSVEQFVRDYARGIIDTWLMLDGVDCKAKANTIYRTWRSGEEFDLICSFISCNF